MHCFPLQLFCLLLIAIVWWKKKIILPWLEHEALGLSFRGPFYIIRIQQVNERVIFNMTRKFSLDLIGESITAALSIS